MPQFKDIFYWENWDEVIENIDVYYNCVILKDIGSDLKDGDEFEHIYFNKEQLTLDFYKNVDDPNPVRKDFVLKE